MQLSDEITREEFEALDYVRSTHPNSWKARLRTCWETGDFSEIASTDSIAAILQGLRNIRGPSWLSGLKLPKEWPA